MQMAESMEREIAARAYRLWSEAGQPQGRDEEFWTAAEQELRNEEVAPLRTPDTL
jgi:hypothetical protein